MLSRQASNSSSICLMDSEAAAGYIRELSVNVAKYRNNKSTETIVLLNRTASFLSTINPQHFNPLHIGSAKFFIDLHFLIKTVPSDSDTLWTCVLLLQHCCKNLVARQAIIDDYRFVPLLADILKRVTAQDKIQRLLSVLQDLTYGINITWEEPYVNSLLEQMIYIIYNTNGQYDKSHVQLALSILINLCYKNFVVLLLFLRTVNISNFSRHIKNHGMLANQMLIILSEDVYAPDPDEFNLFLRLSFTAIGDCLKNWDVPHLNHIVGFLLDSKAHNGLHSAMLCYKNYCADIEHLLNQLTERSDADDSNEEIRKQKQFSMSLIFKFISYILELSNVTQTNDTEGVINIDKSMPQIFEFVSNWLVSDICGEEAVNLLKSLIESGKNDSITSQISRNPSLIVDLIEVSERNDSLSTHSTAIIQFLIVLLHQSKTEKLILSKITESYFDKIFAPLLSLKPEMLNMSITLKVMEKTIFCLLLLINFAEIARKAYYEKVSVLLQSKQIQAVIARALLSKNPVVCEAVFQISRFEHFPRLEIAKQITNFNMAAAIPTQNEYFRNINTILKSEKTFIRKETEERLDGLIEVISVAQQNNQLQNLTASQITEFFNYKIEKLNGVEESLNKRLEDASFEITRLAQQISLQNAELQKYHAINFKLQVDQECLQTQFKDLKKQKDNLKRSTTDLMKKTSEQSEILQVNEKRLALKTSEIIGLQNENKTLRGNLKLKLEELDKLQIQHKENIARIEKLKKSLSAYEIDIKDKTRIIEQRRNELEIIQKALEDQKEAKKKSDGVISVLEAQIQEKNEQIRNYELELTETEEMRKTIMSLMESKKPKRKM